MCGMCIMCVCEMSMYVGVCGVECLCDVYNVCEICV